MKKLSYIILGFILGALLTYYFCPKQDDMKAIEAKTVKPNGVISVKEAIALNDNWTNERQKAVDSAAQSYGREKDDRSTWWSLADIENYLDFAKNEAESLGYNMSGIRVYLGVYGEDAGQSKKNLTTMFIVPTGEKSLAEANMSLFRLPPNDPDVPGGSPLNNGSGGNGGYPQ